MNRIWNIADVYRTYIADNVYRDFLEEFLNSRNSRNE